MRSSQIAPSTRSATGNSEKLTTRSAENRIYISTDLVFNGHKQWYRETDCPEPLSVYGQTKAEAERAVLHHRHHLVLRISLLFGPSLNGRPSFFQQQINALRDGLACQLFEDEWRTPLSLPVAAQGILLAAASETAGILHLAGPQRLSRLEMGQRLARVLGKSPQLCKPTRREDITAAEPRPRDTSLNCQLWEQTFPDLARPDYESSLQDMLLG